MHFAIIDINPQQIIDTNHIAHMTKKKSWDLPPNTLWKTIHEIYHLVQFEIAPRDQSTCAIFWKIGLEICFKNKYY